MTHSKIKDLLKNRIAKFENKADKIERYIRWLSSTRTAVFISGFILMVFFANERSGLEMAISSIASIILFSIVVRVHNGQKFTWQQTRHLIQINEEEMLRVDGELQDLPSGNEFIEESHPYAIDLDVFGRNSMFQLLNRSRLSGSALLMKEWLLNLAVSNKEIIGRQAAVKELIKDTDFRQRMTALSYATPKTSSEAQIRRLVQWMNESLNNFDKPIWIILQWLMPTIALSVLLVVYVYNLPYYWYALPLLVNTIVFRFIFAPLLEITRGMDGVTKHLHIYALIIREIKQESFESEKLTKLSEKLTSGKKTADEAIHKLDRILYFLENRANMLYIAINSYFLTDLFILNAAQVWKKEFLHYLGNWRKSVHEFQVLSDLASFATLNPEYVFPQLDEEKYTVEAKNLGHPMIKWQQRIANNVSIKNSGTLGLITGSNMSGKSTFLRTVGVNLVLAQMGAPVCASNFLFSITKIFTSMRTQDNLEENVSSFYAELKRIKVLLDSLGEEPIFYLLDEILKGTNSEDRHKGALALIEQLTQSQCMGLISTHDIQLSKLAKSNTNLINQSFNSEIRGDEIIFDYKLTEGPCKSFNASKLMEKMGIIK